MSRRHIGWCSQQGLGSDRPDVLVRNNDVVEPHFGDVAGGSVGDLDLVFDEIQFQGGVIAPLEAFEGLAGRVWGPTAPKP